MPKEIFDLENAILNDEIEPLFVYKFGSIELPIFPSSSLTGEDSFLYVKSQLFAAAVAKEYDDLRTQGNDILEQNKDSGMSRDMAERYTEITRQLTDKSVELDMWTLRYVAALAKTDPEEFASKMQIEIDRINNDSGKSISISKLTNALYQKINSELTAITVKTEDEEDADLYDRPDPAQLEGKAIESEPTTDSENTVNGSSTVATCSTTTSEVVEVMS